MFIQSTLATDIPKVQNKAQTFVVADFENLSDGKDNYLSDGNFKSQKLLNGETDSNCQPWSEIADLVGSLMVLPVGAIGVCVWGDILKI